MQIENSEIVPVHANTGIGSFGPAGRQFLKSAAKKKSNRMGTILMGHRLVRDN
jgi:hypothetical protein